MITVSGGGTFDGQGAFAWSQNNCSKSKHCFGFANLRFDFVTNSIIQDVTSLISKNFHVHVYGCNNVTFQHVHITAKIPMESISANQRGSTLLIHTLELGMIVHGISIGSLGRYDNEESLAGIIVKNCTLTNTQNNVHIKTWPNSPVATAKYDNLPPSKVKINDVSFKNIQGSSATALSLKILADIDLTYSGAKGTLTSQCSNVKPTISGLTGALACATSSHMVQSLSLISCISLAQSKVVVPNGTYMLIKASFKGPCKLKQMATNLLDWILRLVLSTSISLSYQIVCSSGIPCENVELADINFTYNGNKGPLTSQGSNVKPTITHVPNALACATSS
ncbi:unnamed protein product [Malus baccata var. baccata]